MAKYQLLLPRMGESVAEATIVKWVKNPGDYINADDTVIEIATDKVDSEVPSPVSGRLVEQLCKEDDVVQVGDVVAIIETDEPESNPEPKPEPIAQPVAQPQQQAAPQQPVTPAPEATIPGTGLLGNRPQSSGTFNEAFKASARFYSPLVKHIATQENISVQELDSIPGTGAEGRLTKDDLLNYVQAKQNGGAQPVAQSPTPAVATPAPTPVAPPVPKVEQQPVPVQQAAPAQQAPPTVQSQQAISDNTPRPTPTSVSQGDEIIEMDRMRRLIADHMVMSKQTSPHVTSFVEADVTSLVIWREKVKSDFEKREGEKITFTPIFIEAVVKAIKEFPMINISVNGTQIIKRSAINISMATVLPNGNLIVPVIKKADELSLIGLTKSVNDLAKRSRAGKLQPDDVKDGTFTFTNIGSFGNIMGVPIINQPQVAILAVGVIKKKPAVIETEEGDVIAIRHMMYMSMSYDHRVVDGALGGMFLRRVADHLENWDINRTA
jgi:2-oxoglutarate dehydrogenase E2 component (dihydrolipoamide succinyltransferase)